MDLWGRRVDLLRSSASFCSSEFYMIKGFCEVLIFKGLEVRVKSRLEISGGALWGRLLVNWGLVVEVLEGLKGRCEDCGVSFYSSCCRFREIGIYSMSML